VPGRTDRFINDRRRRFPAYQVLPHRRDRHGIEPQLRVRVTRELFRFVADD
jgi:hypothetical protein